MLSIEKNIVPLIESQFPALYREEGELFITFIKAYYEWLEGNHRNLFLNHQLVLMLVILSLKVIQQVRLLLPLVIDTLFSYQSLMHFVVTHSVMT